MSPRIRLLFSVARGRSEVLPANGVRGDRLSIIFTLSINFYSNRDRPTDAHAHSAAILGLVGLPVCFGISSGKEDSLLSNRVFVSTAIVPLNYSPGRTRDFSSFMYLFVCIFANLCMSVCLCLCVCACVYIWMFERASVYACLLVSRNVKLPAPVMDLSVYVSVCVSLCLFLSVSIYLRVFTLFALPLPWKSMKILKLLNNFFDIKIFIKCLHKFFIY